MPIIIKVKGDKYGTWLYYTKTSSYIGNTNVEDIHGLFYLLVGDGGFVQTDLLLGA